MGALDQTRSNQLIDASLGTTALTATTTPLKTRLMTANGTSSSNGTEVTGGSYASQTTTFGAASAGSAASSVAVTVTGMPAVTVVGVELWDSNATPKRQWWGALSANKTTNAGDTFTIPSGSLTVTIN